MSRSSRQRARDGIFKASETQIGVNRLAHNQMQSGDDHDFSRKLTRHSSILFGIPSLMEERLATALGANSGN